MKHPFPNVPFSLGNLDIACFIMELYIDGMRFMHYLHKIYALAILNSLGFFLNMYSLISKEPHLMATVVSSENGLALDCFKHKTKR